MEQARNHDALNATIGNHARRQMLKVFNERKDV
jgi:hypothetical protein